MEPIILASTSPRRQEIMKNLGLPFSVLTPAYDEITPEGMDLAAQAEYHSVKKVESIMRMQLKISTPWILGADTMIALDGQTYGKPSDREDAARMLRTWSGKTHQVITGISLYDANTNYISSKVSINQVSFISLSDSQIEAYLDTAEWQGVAGAYRIQGQAACFINHIEGSYSGIVGLPIHELYAILHEHGYPFLV